MAGVIYVLVGTKKNGEEEIFYCGRAEDASSREQRHRRDCADPLNAKPAYEWARQNYNRNFRLEVIANEDASNTEDFWVVSLVRDGHPLQNAVRGNSVVPKKRATSPVARAFREVNARADREERKMSSAQQLTRPQVLQMRIREDVPTAGELHQLMWKQQPVEAMGTRCMKGVKRCEYLKFGDYSIYLGWKAGETRAEVRITNKHANKEARMDATTIVPGDRLTALLRITELWADPYVWWPVGSFT